MVVKFVPMEKNIALLNDHIATASTIAVRPDWYANGAYRNVFSHSMNEFSKLWTSPEVRRYFERLQKSTSTRIDPHIYLVLRAHGERASTYVAKTMPLPSGNVIKSIMSLEAMLPMLNALPSDALGEGSSL